MNKKEIVLIVLLLGWTIGLSGRFLYEFMIRGMATYTTNAFDIVFDWSGLFLLGVLNFAYFLNRFYRDGKILNRTCERIAKRG